MTRLLFFPLFFLSLNFSVAAQNLIPDPGFEIHNENCAPSPGLTYWYNPNLATPDTWCYPGEPCGPILTEALMEELLVLPPFEGNCMAGIFVADPITSSIQVREYLSTELLEALSSGVEYIISFRLFRHVVYDAAIDKIGIHFSEELPAFETPEMLPVEPQVELDTLITTTDEWVFVSRSYVAHGGERFMTFGNFRDHDEMTYVLMGLSWKTFKNAYYFFDDMRLTPRETSVTEQPVENNIHWNGRQLDCFVYERTNCTIYDVRGRLVETKVLSPGSVQVNLQFLPTGIYIARFEGNTRSSHMKIWKE